MSGVNKVIILGRLGQDPETKYLPSGQAVTNISVATSEKWKDKQTGQQQEKTEWHKISFFGRLAEIAGEYLKKGSQVYVEGSLQTRKWQAQDGSDRYTTEIKAREMRLVDGAPQGQQQAPRQQAPQQQYNQAPQQGYNQAPQQQTPQHAQQNLAPPPPPQQGVQADPFADDIPF